MRTQFTKLMTVLTFLAVVIVGCKKHEENKTPTVVVVGDSIVVTHNSAMLCAKVTAKGGYDVTECGFCYAKQGENFDTLFCAGSNGFFSVELTGLLPSTAYSCKAFADNAIGRGYSETFNFTTMDNLAPKVKTFEVTDIAINSAVAHGQVVSDGGLEVVERGVCFGFESHPTIEDAHVASGSGVGRFDCQLTNLSPETVYYIRAYAVCDEGVFYGEERLFGTAVIPMEVHTTAVLDVTGTRVRAKGEVVHDGGLDVTECGFCWGTEPQPTIEGLHIKASYGMGEFGCYFSGFERGVTHYVRAYAINEEGVAYGEEMRFVPDDLFTPWQSGTLPGAFSVAPGRQVRFSQGNLQYKPSDFVWRFAERQWDFVGGACQGEQIGDINFATVFENGIQCDNICVVNANYAGWIDLFGWGTSGWNNGNTYYQPNDYAGYVFLSDLYGPPGTFDLVGDYAQADWGTNIISNGGLGQWRTPTSDELLYLLTERNTPSGMRFVMADVAGVRGMVLLPDDWNGAVYSFFGINELAYYGINEITGREWLEVLEPAGAVFLPAAGDRFQYSAYNGLFFDWFGNELFYTLSDPGNPYEPSFVSGTYWTVSTDNGTSAYAMFVRTWGEAEWLVGSMDRCVGCSVRLVTDVR